MSPTRRKRKRATHRSRHQRHGCPAPTVTIDCGLFDHWFYPFHPFHRS